MLNRQYTCKYGFSFIVLRQLTTTTTDTTNQLNLSNVVVLNKITRYEFEKKRYSYLNENGLKTKLTKSGSSYDQLVKHHDRHYKSLEGILNAFHMNNIKANVVQRDSYTFDDVQNADAIFTAGGDGTFLLAAAKINDCTKPVIGINTDIANSEGYLLLPGKQSTNFSETLKKILDGKFKWLLRTRIRVKIVGEHLNSNPIELHDQVLQEREYRFIEHMEEHRTSSIQPNQVYNQKIMDINNNGTNSEYTIPVRSLNEIFIGESLSARVSYFKMSIDDRPFFKQKSSGIIFCTGTGSTSWCYNIQKMSQQSIKEIIKIINTKLNKDVVPLDDTFLHSLVKEFNDHIVFEPKILKMAYTIRDPIINRIYQNETTHGFAKKIFVQSRCFDACLVIDGGISYQFNNGAIAVLEIHPEDSLKTLIVDDD